MDYNTTANVFGTVIQLVELACDFIVLMLPWMILSAIKAVREEVKKANDVRTIEARNIVKQLERLHSDLYNLTATEEG